MAKADVNNYRDSDTEQLLKLKRCVKVGHVFIEISYKLHKFIYLNKPLEYLPNETYKQCVIRHVCKFLNGL